VKKTTLEKMNAMRLKRWALCSAISFFCLITLAQDNSPYSRYGLGDHVPNTNIINRGMAGISAAYTDPFSINFNNPASYSSFFSRQQLKSKKSEYGRVLFDVGINFDNRTLKENNPPQKFPASNAVFSYMQLGIPVRNNWGLNFGLRQLSRVDYKIFRTERLYDPGTGQAIDSAITEFTGNGGAFLATTGTGFATGNLSVGINFGYLFGNKENATKRAFINDTVAYETSNHTTKTSFGKVYLDAGVQYKIDLQNNMLLRLGAYGNMKNTLNAQQDIIRETIVRSADNGDIRVDSVYQQNGVKGKIIYPATYGLGFTIGNKINEQKNKYGTWMLGADLVKNNWDQYRFYGAKDSVTNSWELRVGGQLRPEPKPRSYFSNVAYRAGFFVGTDYIHVVSKLPVFGISFGMGLPIANYNQLSRGQASIINVSLEYIKRGNNDNLLKENLFRISVGLSFSDLWFVKRHYE
jgi:hypothetical protein